MDIRKLRFCATELGPAEFERMSAIRRLTDPYTPGSPNELRRAHEIRVRDLPYYFAFMEVGDQTVGYCALKPSVVLKEPGLHQISLALLPEYCGKGIEEEALRQIEEAGRRLGAKRLGTRASTDHPTLVALYDNNGFERVQSDLITGVDLAGFDAAQFEVVLKRVELQGVEIVDAVELSRTGSSWLRPAYDLNTRLMADVPIPGEYEPRTFEQWSKELLDPAETDLSLQFYARLDGELIGETGLFVLENGSGNVVTGLTGVLGPYRRSGIATALKVKSLAVAKSKGLRTVLTGNERNNPMYLLNLKLGYTDRYEDITFWR